MPKNKLLLHVCCAPCAIYPLEQLVREYEATIYFYDPNIYPKAEYILRRDEMKKFAKKIGVEFVEGEYDATRWFQAVKGLEREPEKGARCEVCFDVRLAETARKAKDEQYDAWTTVLTISPHKSAEQVNRVGRRLAQKFNIPFLVYDFKKNNGFKIASALSKQENFYRQDYCGCIYSYANKSI